MNAEATWSAERMNAENRRSVTHATDLVERTKKFAVAVIAFTEGLPPDSTCRILSKQLVRCGTSVGANYRAAKRARSSADFIAKMGLVEEEADECVYWFELLTASGKVRRTECAALIQEATELLAIAIASIHTARNRLNAARARPKKCE
jgi:four helix bundle protein